jgi:hypothetical protein
VVGNVDDNVAPGTPVLGGLADLPTVCAKHNIDRVIDRVIVAFPNTSDANVLGALRQLRGQLPVSEIPRYFELHSWRSEAEELPGLTLMHLPTASLGLSARLTKRIMDTTLAICALVFAAPILLVIAVAVRLDTPGPVFFRQERIGKSGKPFRIFKFRSMTVDAWQRRNSVAQLNEVDGPLFPKMESDPRVTRIGSFIRRTGLDELPQLINVVRRDVFGGAAANAAHRGVQPPGRRRAGSPEREAGHHRAVASLWPQRCELRGSGAPRLGIRPILVADVGCTDHCQDAPGCVRAQGCILTLKHGPT